MGDMCTCVQKEKQDAGLGYWNYVFECVDGDHRHIEVVMGQTNDTQARMLAEQQCAERHE
jgi:hypothetical protein